ncbi:hypothetical protein N42HA_00739 [Lactococcus lactis]|nr:hypothetical protein [Lactococcus lactis]
MGVVVQIGIIKHSSSSSSGTGGFYVIIQYRCSSSSSDSNTLSSSLSQGNSSSPSSKPSTQVSDITKYPSSSKIIIQLVILYKLKHHQTSVFPCSFSMQLLQLAPSNIHRIMPTSQNINLAAQIANSSADSASFISLGPCLKNIEAAKSDIKVVLLYRRPLLKVLQERVEF